MRKTLAPLVVLGIIFAGASALPALSDDRPSNVPTKRQPNSPFGTDWAKPGGTTGSYIYNDPRLRDPQSPLRSQRKTRCPAPLLYDPASGRCR